MPSSSPVPPGTQQPEPTEHAVAPGEAAPSFDEHDDDASADPFSQDPEDGGSDNSSNPQ